VRQEFETEQWLPYPLEVVFAFFGNPANLPRLMPAWQSARIEEASLVPPERPTVPIIPGIYAGNGSRILIATRPFPFAPFRLPWLAEIEDFRWNEGFCDTQLRGPFRYWRHCHTVRREDRNGAPGTLVRDAVTYEAPRAPFSSLILKPGIAYTFRIRHQRAEQLLQAATKNSYGGTSSAAAT